MASFWALFMLAAYGILSSSFILILKGWLNSAGAGTDVWVDQVPILGEFGSATLVALVLQMIVGLVLYRLLSRPKTVDYLIETEEEMKRVVWPSWKDTWSGASAVIVTVVVMLLFLLAVDWVFLGAFQKIFGLG